MDKELLRRAATRTIIEDPEGEATEVHLTVRVSGQVAEFHRQQEMPWDNESGTGNDVDVQTWSMSLDTLKDFVKAAQWCIEKSEAFEKKHPMAAEKVVG